jgi:hypothetical protein
MKNRQKHPLPFLVTLAGCVLMLAWVDPVNATEVTRQLTQQGYSISQLRKSDVAVVQSSHNDLKVIFKGFAAQASSTVPNSGMCRFNLTSNYHVVFPNVVKSSLQADIRSWRKRE